MIMPAPADPLAIASCAPWDTRPGLVGAPEPTGIMLGCRYRAGRRARPGAIYRHLPAGSATRSTLAGHGTLAQEDRRCLLLGLLIAACSSPAPPSPSPDPGNVELHQLEHDPFLTTLPAKAHPLGRSVWVPATWNVHGLRWRCPCFTIAFSDTDGPSAVAAFYSSEAVRFGWGVIPSQSGGLGGWQKRTGETYASASLYSGYNLQTGRAAADDFTLYGGG